jgi:hypothetical protein
MTHTKTREVAFTVLVRETETYSSDPTSSDPTPRRPALRVVTVDGETIEESTRPLARCRQVSPVVVPLHKKLRRLA